LLDFGLLCFSESAGRVFFRETAACTLLSASETGFEATPRGFGYCAITPEGEWQRQNFGGMKGRPGLVRDFVPYTVTLDFILSYYGGIFITQKIE